MYYAMINHHDKYLLKKIIIMIIIHSTLREVLPFVHMDEL